MIRTAIGHPPSPPCGERRPHVRDYRERVLRAEPDKLPNLFCFWTATCLRESLSWLPAKNKMGKTHRLAHDRACKPPHLLRQPNPCVKQREPPEPSLSDLCTLGAQINCSRAYVLFFSFSFWNQLSCSCATRLHIPRPVRLSFASVPEDPMKSSLIYSSYSSASSASSAVFSYGSVRWPARRQGRRGTGSYSEDSRCW